MSDNPIETELSGRMRRLHREGAEGLPENWLELADKFDQASADFFHTPRKIEAKQFMGHFARARRAWCDYTGEPLV